MAFPTTVTTDGLHRGIIGPFVSSSGDVYVGCLSADSYNLRMHKATDPASSFANVGTDIVIGSGTDETWAISGFMQGDLIHCITKNGVSGGTTVDLRYHVFDVSSDTWTTSNTVIKSDMTLAAGSDGLRAMIDIALRGDGSILVIYNGAAELVTGTLYDRVFYARNLSGSWSADIALGSSGAAENWVGGRIVLGEANRIHFFFQNLTTNDTYQRTLNTSNNLQSLPTAFEPTSEAFETHEQRGTFLSATGVVHFPVYSAANQLDNAQFSSSDTPSVTISADITGATNPLGAPFRNIISYAPHGNTVVAAFLDASNDIYTMTKVGGASFGAPSLHRASSASAIYTNAYTRSSALVLGMVFLNSGDHFYDELTLSSIVAGGGSLHIGGMSLLGVGH